jgi:thiosulfate/3-mercaptopyruvate sulfurtransferase
MTYRTLVSVADLQRLMASRDVLVVDCGFDLGDPDAGEKAWREGHIPGARYLHLDRDLSGPATGHNGRHPLPDPQAFAATLRAKGLRAGQQVVAYDGQGGFYAARLWWMLRWIGHAAVAVLDGGRQAWADAGGAVETGAPAGGEPGDFLGMVPDPAATVDAAAVLDNIAHPAFLLVDARTAARFAGAPDPLDAVAGHIPGATNRFFKDNLGPDGRFKAPGQLASEWRAVLGGMPADRSVMQCGSGVTACHNLLALEVAGLTGAKLYPGSWSEWVADPARPVARGA